MDKMKKCFVRIWEKAEKSNKKRNPKMSVSSLQRNIDDGVDCLIKLSSTSITHKGGKNNDIRTG
jgi:hypothetical protein